MFDRLNKKIRLILKDVIFLTYNMNGALSYDYALYGLTYVERTLIAEHIEEEREALSKQLKGMNQLRM